MRWPRSSRPKRRPRQRWTVFSSITKALKKKDTVTLIGFGTFKVGQRKARKGRNPQTGEEIKIKAKKVAKFVPGKALKDAIT